MSVKLADIAKRVGVTQSTVSTVLNNRRCTIRVSDETRGKIIAAAKDLSYIPSFQARALAQGRTYSLGMLCGNIHSFHYSEMASIALREAESRGYHLLISVTEWRGDDLECLETLLGRGVDGVLYWGPGLALETNLRANLLDRKYPLVTVVHDIEGFSSITSDWQLGVDQAMQHLVEQGRRRVMFVGSAAMGREKYDKYQAFLRACLKFDVEPLECFTHATKDLEGCEQVGAEISRRADRPEAILASSDQVATGLMKGLRDNGVAIPGDIALIGMDGTQIGKYLQPTLTSVAQDRRRTVVEGIEMILRMIEKKESPGRKLVLPTELIVRESSRPSE